MAETNMESHGTFQKLGAIEPSCSVPCSIPQWREAVVDRARSNFETFKNHTAILFWSLGNESYAGDDIEAMNTYFKEKQDGRFVHYESSFYDRNYEETISDVESRMYAKPYEVEEYLNNNPKKEELKKASKDKRKVTSDEYLISELKAEYDRISNSTVSCYQSYREGKYTKEEYVQLRKTNQELLADLENQISDLQEKVANQEPDAEEKIEQLTQYSMLEQYDGDVLSNIIDKVLIYNDKDIEVVFKGENFIRNAV